MDLLKHPVQWTTDQEVRLYTTREVLRTEGGQEVVHPAPDNPVKWLLTPDGQLRLTTGNRTVGTTTVAQTNPIETVDLPRLIPTAAVGDSTVWAVLDANGDMITRYQDRQSLFSDWQLVRPAFVPTRLMYIDAVCVYIPDPEEPGLIPCRLHRGIDYGVREMRDSMRTFLDMYTAHQAGQHLPADTVRDWWQAWISAQRDESPPRDNWFKRTLQDALCIDSHNGTRRITDRTWAYPRRDAPR